MRLIGNHRKAFAVRRGQFLHGLERKGKGLDRADHDFLAAGQSRRQLAAFAGAFALDRRHHAGGALEVENRFLQLAIQHVAVRYHQHRIEQLFMVGIVQIGQKMRRPGNRIGFAGTGRMLNQVFSARPFLQHRSQ